MNDLDVMHEMNESTLSGTALRSPRVSMPSAPRRDSVAIIGAGISGLGCAHFLHRHRAITVFDQAPWIGGHAHTVDVKEAGRALPVDTGFMVYNEVTYPLLTRLFAELRVPTKPTSMSFSVQHEPADLEFSGSSVNHLFAQRRNLLRPRYWRFLHQIDRFNRDALPALADPATAQLTLGHYVEARGYGADFLHHYLLPMSGAVWSAPPAEMLRFPAVTLLRFFHNHGFLGLHTQHPWRTVDGGSRIYVEKLTAPFREHLRRGCAVVGVRRHAHGAELQLADGRHETFAQVIFACHADEALALLGDDASPLERRLLSAFRYHRNHTLLHTDASVMPRTRRAWSSWNYRVRTAGTGDATRCTTHYWMNSLQGVSERTNYFVSLNAAAEIDPARVLRSFDYLHPLFDLRAIEAQAELPQLNHLQPGQTTFFAGGYFRYGFHEDGLLSAYNTATALLGADPWPTHAAARTQPTGSVQQPATPVHAAAS